MMVTQKELQDVVSQVNQKFQEQDHLFQELTKQIGELDNAIRKGNVRKSTGKTTKKAEE